MLQVWRCRLTPEAMQQPPKLPLPPAIQQPPLTQQQPLLCLRSARLTALQQHLPAQLSPPPPPPLDR